MATVTQIGPRLGIAPTCAALGLPRATYYRRRRPSRAAPPRRPSPRALSAGERGAVLALLHEPRFVDHAPAEVYADRKSTRLNSSHTVISYAVFCLKKKKKETMNMYKKDNRNRP